MDDASFSAFSDELVKIAGLRDIWQRFIDLFRTEDEKTQRRVNYHFSPKAGKDKWDKLVRNANDPKFVSSLSKHPDADPTLIQHAKSMGELSRSPPVGKIQSSRIPGQSYEIRQLPGGGLGCTGPDWRFKGSITPGYECKHIKAYRAGKLRAD